MAAEHVLVVASSDPATSHRANEAVRIALGILAGENRVTLVLLGPAAKILGPDVEEYVDGEDTVKHLATLDKLGQTFHVERAAMPGGGNGAHASAGGRAVVPISLDDLARMMAECDRVLVF